MRCSRINASATRFFEPLNVFASPYMDKDFVATSTNGMCKPCRGSVCFREHFTLKILFSTLTLKSGTLSTLALVVSTFQLLGERFSERINVYAYVGTHMIDAHIGNVVEVSMGYAADKVLVVEHYSLMQQCR